MLTYQRKESIHNAKKIKVPGAHSVQQNIQNSSFLENNFDLNDLQNLSLSKPLCNNDRLRIRKRHLPFFMSIQNFFFILTAFNQREKKCFLSEGREYNTLKISAILQPQVLNTSFLMTKYIRHEILNSSSNNRILD